MPRQTLENLAMEEVVDGKELMVLKGREPEELVGRNGRECGCVWKRGLDGHVNCSDAGAAYYHEPS